MLHASVMYRYTCTFVVQCYVIMDQLHVVVQQDAFVLCVW